MGILNDLNPQNLIDCLNVKYGSYNCNAAGSIYEYFEYIRNNSGITSDSVYKGQNGECRYDSNYMGVKVTGNLLHQQFEFV